MKLLERAAELAPRDITIQDNLEKLRAAQSSACFIATAAYGTSSAAEVQLLRAWRDNRLLTSRRGEQLVRFYYRLSPPIAQAVARSRLLRAAVRLALIPLLHIVKRG